MRSTARVKEKLSRRVKKESGGALWKRCPRRGAIMGSRMVYKRDSSIVLDLQVWREGVSYRRQPGTRSNLLFEVERIKLVWMQREDRGRSGMAQRGKSVAKQRTVRRTRKCSQRGR